MQLGFSSCAPTKVPPKATKGMMDLSDWDFEKDGPVRLEGEWEFYWNKFCQVPGNLPKPGRAADFYSDCDSSESIYLSVPGKWNHLGPKDNPSFGYGTYRMKLNLPKGGKLGIKWNYLASSKEIYLNSELVHQSESLGKEKSLPPQGTRPLVFSSAEIEKVTIHISNFVLANGGLGEAPAIGLREKLASKEKQNLAWDMVIFSALLVIGFYHLGLFLQRPEDRSSFYFSVICLFLSVRQMITGNDTVFEFIPHFSWYWSTKLGHLSYYIAVSFFLLYVKSLFRFPLAKLYYLYQFLFLSSAFSILFISLPSLNILTSYSLYVLVVILVHILLVILKNFNTTQGKIFLITFLIFFGCTINDILEFFKIIQTIQLSNLGFLVFFLGQANLLSSLFSKAFRENKEIKQILELKVKELQLEKERATKAYLDLEASQKQLVQSDKMITLGTMVAGVAHEINSPLGAIKANSVNIQESLQSLLQKLNPKLSDLSLEDLNNSLLVLDLSKEPTMALSSREERSMKKKVIAILEERNQKNVDMLTDYIVELGLVEALERKEPILHHPEITKYLSIALDLQGILKKSHVIQSSADRVSKIVKSLKSYMHFEQEDKKVMSDLTEGMETVLIILHSKIKYGIEVTKNYGQNVPQILCYPDELNQVWTNLIHNAIQAMEEKGKLQIDIEKISYLSGQPDIDKRNPEYKGEYVAVSIQDSGTGISPEIRSKIFQAFFTTKPAGEGSGLGLHIIGKILEKHFGALYLESEPGKTKFTVMLPIQAD